MDNKLKKVLLLILLSIILPLNSVSVSAKESSENQGDITEVSQDDKTEEAELPNDEKQTQTNDKKEAADNVIKQDKSDLIDENDVIENEIENLAPEKELDEPIIPIPQNQITAFNNGGFNEDDWVWSDQNTGGLSYMTISALKNKNLKNVYIPSVVTTKDGIERIVVIDDFSIFKCSKPELCGIDFSSFKIEAVEHSSNPGVKQYVKLNNQSMEYGLANHIHLKTVDLTGLDVSNVVNIEGLFSGDAWVETIDLSGWNTSKITSMNSVYNGTHLLRELKHASFDTSNVISMEYTFNDSSISSLDLSNWKTDKVTSFHKMFSYTVGLTDLNISTWNTSNATDFSEMFSGNQGLMDLNLSNFNTSKATDMNNMFSKSSLRNINMSSFDTSNVTNFAGMFQENYGMESLDVSGFNTSSATDTSYMFSNTRVRKGNEFQVVDVSHFEMGNVTDISFMFRGFWAPEINVANWDVSSVVDATSTFSGMQHIKEINVKDWDTRSFEKIGGMFAGLYYIRYFDFSGWNLESITDPYGSLGVFVMSLNGTGNTYTPIAVKTHDKYLRQYNYKKDYRSPGGPTKLAMNGKFADGSTEQRMRDNVFVEDESELIITAQEYNDWMKIVPTANNSNEVFVGWDPAYNTKTTDTKLLEDTSVFKALYGPTETTITFNVEGTETVVTLPTNSLVQPDKVPATTVANKEFKEWNTQSDGLGQKFDPSLDIVSKPTYVYAIYEAKQHTVTFKDGDTVIATAKTNHNSPLNVEQVPNAPEKVGYTFVGWNKSADLDGDTYLPTTEKVTQDITVYAKYDINNVTVTFKDGETTLGVATTKYNNLVKPEDVPTAPSKAGYDFAGWNTKEDGTGSTFDPTTTTVRSDIIVYAKYTIKSYTVSFMVDNQLLKNGTTSYNTVLPTDQIPVTPVKEGYNFIGWATTPDGEEMFNPKTAKITENIAVYAKFVAQDRKVTFIVDGAIIDAVTTKYDTILPQDLIPTNPVKEGYTFVEWNMAPGGVGDPFIPSTKKITENISVYAVFTIDNYTVNFFDGTEKLGDASTEFNQLLPQGDVPVNPTKDGHTFIEWNTAVDGTGQTFDPASTKVVASITVYAKFEIENYTVTFFNGTANLGDASTEYNTKLNPTDIPANPTKDGHTFTEWNTKADGTGDSFDPTTALITKSMNVYAQFSVNDYTVTFMNETDLHATATTKYDTTITTENIPSIPTKEGHTFVEWNTAADGTGTTFDPATTKVVASITVYAQYSTNDYTVTFMNETVEHATAITKYDTTIATENIPSIPTKEGHTFIEWNTAADGSGTTFDPATTKVVASITVYAQYSTNDYTVTFIDGEQVIANASTAFDTVLNPTDVPANPVKKGYTFIEWNTKADGTGDKFEAETARITENVNVYAQYAVNKYNVTFVAQGVTLGSVTVSYNTLLNANQIPKAPIIKGYKFIGWNRKADGSGEMFTPMSERIVEDVTVYAQFTAETYHVTFDNEGNIEGVANTSYNTLLNQNDVPTTPNKTGYTFVEWNSKADGTGVKFDPSSELITESKTVYAKYIINKYTVIFDDEGKTSNATTDYNTVLNPKDVPANPTKDGYTFVEWNTQKDGKGESFDASTALIKNDITVYAIYKKVDKPIDPVKPVDPVKPTPEKPKPTTPPTGVDTNKSTFVIGAAASLLAILGLSRKRKEESEEK